MTVRIEVGDNTATMRRLIAEGARVQTIVTSPPYFGLRDYGHAEQIGLESSPAEFIAKLVAVFDVARDLLADDGTLWVNMGDSYAGGGGHSPNAPSSATSKSGRYGDALISGGIKPAGSIKPKDLCGIPWRLAFALQDAGWYLRQDIIWAKPNPMPESVTDRCTKAHEYLFLLSKSPRYYFDAAAIAEQAVYANTEQSFSTPYKNAGRGSGHEASGNEKAGAPPVKIGDTRNKRSVWTVATQPFSEAHFATFPPALIEPCILAGSRPGDIVLDPFGGAGTTGLVADRHQRSAILCELNPEYAAMAKRRIFNDAPLFAEVA